MMVRLSDAPPRDRSAVACRLAAALVCFGALAGPPEAPAWGIWLRGLPASDAPAPAPSADGAAPLASPAGDARPLASPADDARPIIGDVRIVTHGIFNPDRQ